jgi:hypothetical protein
LWPPRSGSRLGPQRAAGRWFRQHGPHPWSTRSALLVFKLESSYLIDFINILLSENPLPAGSSEAGKIDEKTRKLYYFNKYLKG